MARHVLKWLLAEECKAVFYTGWWLYLRDRNDHGRNDNGEWGWQCGEYSLDGIEQFLRSVGDDPPKAHRHSQDLAKWFSKKYPKGLRVLVNHYGTIVGLADSHTPKPEVSA